jgi:hypothetical protein
MSKNTARYIFRAVCALFVVTWFAASSFVSCAGRASGDVRSSSAAKTDEAPRANRLPDTTVQKEEVEKDMFFQTEIDIDKKSKGKESGEGMNPEASIEAARRLTLSDDLRVRSPEMLARLDKPDTEPLPLAAHDISVVIVGHRARVVYDMVFTNPSARVVSGTLMVELPQGASPCYLGMYQGAGVKKGDEVPIEALLPSKPPAAEKLLAPEILLDKTWQSPNGLTDWGELRAARVVNPVQGREVYEKVTRRRVDPALSEWAGGNKFSTRVFPIPANGFKRVVFAYDRPLQFSSGTLSCPIPLPVEIKAPTRLFIRHVSGEILRGKLLMAGKEIPPTADGPFWKIIPDKDLKGAVMFTGAAGQKNVSVLAGSDPQVPGKLLHILYAPQITAAAGSHLTGRAVFFLDTSLSGKDKLFRRSGALLKAILEADNSITRSAVIVFDVRASNYTAGFVKNTPQNRGALFQSLEGLWLEGATNFSSALTLAAEDRALSSADTYFLLSDGQITWGNTNPRELETGFRELLDKRWICYGFGDEAVNRPLFEALTKSRGQIVQTGAEQDLQKAALAHRQAPAALDSVFGQNQEEILVSGDPRLLYPGQVLSIACRTRGSVPAVKLTVSINGKKQTVAVNAAENALTNALASRAWAEVYANRLLDLYDKDANAQVLALSQRFSLTNREASFIILETDAEYEQHNIDAARLDFKDLSRLALERRTRFPYGSPETDDLPAVALDFLDALKGVHAPSPWLTLPAAGTVSSADVLSSVPALKRPKETTVALYTWAKELYGNAGARDTRARSQALRALSSIVELKPQDDQALRLVGYVLMEWSLYTEAEDLFSLVRQRRPFEPQSYLMEGMALAMEGKAGEAALRFEILVTRPFPRLGEFTTPVAKILYAQVLQSVITASPGTKAASLAGQRLEKLGAPSTPRGRLLLFWNLDDTDVDLHVREPSGEEVYYEHEDSRTGGRLFWDNTQGLGPELYEHPSLNQAGFDVYVDYFGSSSVEGAAPAATLVCAFTRRGQDKACELRFYTTALVGVKEDNVLIMPTWKP